MERRREEGRWLVRKPRDVARRRSDLASGGGTGFGKLARSCIDGANFINRETPRRLEGNRERHGWGGPEGDGFRAAPGYHRAYRQAQDGDSLFVGLTRC